jgi:glycosyltransferase involved in cell wall biosynthesis
MNKPEISVCIPTKNREKSIGKMLNTLTKQSYKNFEVLIIDGGSNDKTIKIVKSFRNKLKIRIYYKRGGLIPQMNKGLKVARGEIFVRTDDDVLTTKNWLKTVKKVFETDKKVGGVTGPTVIPKKFALSRDLFYFQRKLKRGGLLWKAISSFYYGYIMEGNPYRVSHWYKSGAFSLGNNYKSARRKNKKVVNNLEACNWSVRTKLLKKVGGFDPSYSGIGEYHEPDASFKIKNLGYKLIFHPKAEVNHCPSIEGFFNERPLSYPRMINYIIFYKRHIKVDSLDKLLRFSSYLIFQNLYYTYQAISKKQLGLLGCYPATIIGLIFKS